MSFAYEGDSQKPIAAKRGNEEWFRTPVARTDLDKLTPISCSSQKHVIEIVDSVAARVEALGEKELTEEMEEHLRPLTKLQGCDPSSPAATTSGALEIYPEDIDWQTVYFVQNYWDNYIEWSYDYYELKKPIPGERDMCIKACDDLKDALDLICIASAAIPPYGGVVGVACAGVNWAMRGVCRRGCG
jgi:hypothetical protein